VTTFNIDDLCFLDTETKLQKRPIRLVPRRLISGGITMTDDRKIKMRDFARAHRAQLEAAGMVQVAGWVHRSQASKLKLLIKALAANADLSAGPATSNRTGRRVRYDG
jgi:hypothetical protein